MLKITHKGQIVQWSEEVISARQHFEKLLDECKDLIGVPGMKHAFYHLLDLMEQDVKEYGHDESAS
jgi:hypothetical protein